MSKKVVITDSSCLIGLAKTRRLKLLHELFGDLLIPTAVYHEVLVEGGGRPAQKKCRAPTGSMFDRSTMA